MFASALLANGLVAILRRKLAERAGCMIRMVPLAVPAVMLFVFGGSIALGFRPGFLIFLAGACALGIAYGVFLWEVRDYASQAAQNDGKSVLVSWFNNMANVSSLIAFAIMLAIAATKTGAHVCNRMRSHRRCAIPRDGEQASEESVNGSKLKISDLQAAELLGLQRFCKSR
jgi:hypothetical protein